MYLVQILRAGIWTGDDVLSRTAGLIGGCMPEPVSTNGRPCRRRTFSAAYKREILARAEQLRAEGRGGVLALLRREGLRTSHLAEWRKQFSRGLQRGNRGRPGRGLETLRAEIRRLRKNLASFKKRELSSKQTILLQRKYVLAAALKLQRKDRGLLSALIAQVEDAVSISDVCKAMALSRRDFYRTIKPMRMGTGGADALYQPG
jgi:transposase-like protein